MMTQFISLQLLYSTRKAIVFIIIYEFCHLVSSLCTFAGKDADWLVWRLGLRGGILRAKNIFSHGSSRLMSCTVTVKTSGNNLVSGRAEFKVSDEILSQYICRNCLGRLKKRRALNNQELYTRHKCCCASDLLLNPCSADVNVN